MGDRILVFIPCYNCAPQISRVLSQFQSVVPGLFTDLLIVDNGSRDATVEAALAALPPLTQCSATIVRNKENYNLGGSHKAAFRYAAANGHTHVAVLHGDDQAHIQDLVPVLERGDHLRNDACLGSRFMGGSRLEGYSPLRILGNRVFNALFTAAAGRPVSDLGSGLNIFSRPVFASSSLIGYPDDLLFNIHLLLGLISEDRKIMFFPISWREQDQVSNVRMASQAAKTLKIAVEFVIARKSFLTRDHRQKQRQSYEFDVLAIHNPLRTVGGRASDIGAYGAGTHPDGVSPLAGAKRI